MQSEIILQVANGPEDTCQKGRRKPTLLLLKALEGSSLLDISLIYLI